MTDYLETPEGKLLTWCRKRTRNRLPCMRTGGPDKRKRIVDNARWDGPILYAGKSWAIAWHQLIEAGEVAP